MNGKTTRLAARISDVAERAQVSPMTVSRVMNGAPGVRESTREVVLKAIADLGYAPNAAARSLARSGAGRLGLLYSNPSAGYLSEFLLGALEGAHRAGAQLTIEKCDADPDSERAAIRRLASAGVGGVVVPPPHGESEAALDEIAALGLNVVVVAAGRPNPRAAGVRVDDRAAAAEMTRHLLDLGHRRIGFIKGAANQRASAERLAGFQGELAAAGVEGLIEAGDFTYRSGFEATERLLSGDTPPTAVFASNDEMAVAAIAAAHRRGLDVPGQISIVGFDDTPMATTVWPALTTMRQPIAAMAEAAIQVLVRPRTGEAVADQVCAHALIVRESSGPPPAG